MPHSVKVDMLPQNPRQSDSGAYVCEQFLICLGLLMTICGTVSAAPVCAQEMAVTVTTLTLPSLSPIEASCLYAGLLLVASGTLCVADGLMRVFKTSRPDSDRF